MSICVKIFWYEHDSFVLATQAKQVFILMTQNWGKVGELCSNFKIDIYMMCLRRKIQRQKVMSCILQMMKCIKIFHLKIIQLSMIQWIY
uniref:Putative ovule protein n=1 Tax=Solanum chacoense TaxID=4108 RepID=A0A0V0GSV2_SOLCH